jgi:hypothetical protein
MTRPFTKEGTEGHRGKGKEGTNFLRFPLYYSVSSVVKNS